MAYSELIKNFERVRDDMREFFVYGFKSRTEYDRKSARSYDDERRRLESWLGDCMFFRRGPRGKNVFLSVDSRAIPHNPLYRAFKAKSFTARDITLHFCILDLLADGEALSAARIVEQIDAVFLSRSEAEFPLDESTVRKKLREYAALGLLRAEKSGREVLYRRTDGSRVNLDAWAEAIAFFSEEDPLGVIGSTLLDRRTDSPDWFRRKHHYILHALDSEILCALLLAIHERRAVDVTARARASGRERTRTLCPLKIYISARNGRQYLSGYHYAAKRLLFLRLDRITGVRAGHAEKRFDAYAAYQARFGETLWGVSSGHEPSPEHLEMTVFAAPGEEFIRKRLEREKRHGHVTELDDRHLRFTADVWDAMEMLPWLRTFTGRITELTCSNPEVTARFAGDIEAMRQLYEGGASDAVQ